VAVDAHYLRSGGARAAAVVAADAAFSQPLAEHTAVVPEVPPYHPGGARDRLRVLLVPACTVHQLAGVHARTAGANARRSRPACLGRWDCNLNPAGVAWLRGFLHQLGGEGRTVLVSSHLLAEVAQTAGQVIVIDHGRLISSGPVSQLTTATGQAVVVRAPRAAELRVALEAGGAAVRELADGRLEIIGAGTEQVATLAAARGLPIGR
jgi:hypothetical protein